MGVEKGNEFPWVIFSVKKTKCAISAKDVESMVAMPPVVDVPHAPEYVRGVINLRGRVMPVVDLRARMGMTSFMREVDEFCALMHQREQDHKNWLRELEASVREGREFGLATDPHLCAFGKWFDSYKAETHLMEMILQKFRAPHARIHALAAKVKALEAKGEIDEAHRLIDQCRDNELAEMIRLFAEIREAYVASSREICLVFSANARPVAMAVDSIESVERLAEGKFEELPDVLHDSDSDLVTSTGKRLKHDELVLLIDHTRIAGDLDPSALAAPPS